MQAAQSIEQLRLLTGEVRALHKGFLTNFYLDEAKHGVWIAKGDCFFERVGETLFVVKRSDSFWNVFYSSTTQDQLSDDFVQLKALYPAQIMRWMWWVVRHSVVQLWICSASVVVLRLPRWFG